MSSCGASKPAREGDDQRKSTSGSARASTRTHRSPRTTSSPSRGASSSPWAPPGLCRRRTVRKRDRLPLLRQPPLVRTASSSPPRVCSVRPGARGRVRADAGVSRRVMVQIDAHADLHELRRRSGGGYWQNADSTTPSSGPALGPRSARRSWTALSSRTDREPGRGRGVHVHVDVEPVLPEKEPAGHDPRDAPLSVRKRRFWANTLAERLHRGHDLHTRGSGAQATSGCRNAWRHPEEQPRPQDRLFKSYQSQGTCVTAGGQHLRRDQLDLQASPPTSSGPGRRIRPGAGLKRDRAAQGRPACRGTLGVPQFGPTMIYGLQFPGLGEATSWAASRQHTRKAIPDPDKLRSSVAPRRSKAKKRQGRRSGAALRRDYEAAAGSAKRSCLGGPVDTEKAPAAAQSRKGAGAGRDFKKEAECRRRSSTTWLTCRKLNETDIAASIRSNNVSVGRRASRAQPRTHPAEQEKRIVLSVASLLGCSSRVGLASWPATTSINTIKDPEETSGYLHVEPRSRRSPIRRVPDVPFRHEGLPELLHRPHHSPQGRNGTDVVLVTGTVPQEGHGRRRGQASASCSHSSSGEEASSWTSTCGAGQSSSRLGLTREPGGVTELLS